MERKDLISYRKDPLYGLEGSWEQRGHLSFSGNDERPAPEGYQGAFRTVGVCYRIKIAKR